MRVRWFIAILAIAALVPPAAIAIAGQSAARTVHLRGTAYEFNNVRTLLAGATIRVAELPKLQARVRPNGTYDLAVPDRKQVTPYIVAPGYHTIYLQTFTTAGEDLANVNFQTPTEAVYQALVALLRVPVDEAGNPARCAIVSTFNTKNVRDLSYAGFIAYGAHGVAGATASGEPALPAPTYFNEHVIPDSAQSNSSVDGGVVWTGVPEGVYTIKAKHPSTRFASFVATCRNGRVVNANPPWGLHELAPANPARATASWSKGGALRSLTATRLAAKSVVRVSCAGARCPFKSRTLKPSGRTVDIARALGNAASRLRAGQVLTVAVSSHAFNGLVLEWPIRAGKVPKATKLCVPLGESLPRAHC